MAETDDVAAGARKILNSHGYAFEQAVIDRCVKLFVEQASDWYFQISECPVDLHGRPHHIDFVLEHKTGRAVLLAECKRVDPARARWCFVKRAYTRAGDELGKAAPILSTINWDPRGPFLQESPGRLVGDSVYHICVALKTGAPGEAANPDKDKPMEGAAEQAFRSLSGYIQRMVRDGATLLSGVRQVLLLPVIFTTAELLATDALISNADLKTGNIDTDALDPRPVGWLWLQENLSRHLRPEHSHDVLLAGTPEGIERATLRRHTRAVAVVHVDAIGKFLTLQSRLGNHQDYIDRV